FPALAGFRGWSGSARRAVFVAPDDATPGYLPGEMPIGTWHVILGLARVGDEGCPYRVEVEVQRDGEFEADGTGPTAAAPSSARRAGSAAARRSPPPSPASRGPGWYRGDLQSHTFHSDAKGSLEDLSNAARSRGLDFLAVTDHNTVSHHRFLPDFSDASLLLVPGMEVTTYNGHANVWGVDGWVDFRLTGNSDLRRLVDHVHARGGLFSVNHPKRSPGCIGCDWEYELVDGIDCLEAWQGPWPHGNWESLERYDRLLKGGRRVTLVGGSDRHQPGWPDPDPVELQVGSPTTWVYLEELSVAAVLQALRYGRVSVSEDPVGPRLEIWLDDEVMGGVVEMKRRNLEARAKVSGASGDVLRWIGSTGVLREVAITADHFEDRWQLEEARGFLRAEICAGASLPDKRARVEELAAQYRLPWGLRVADVFAQPFRRALSNPVYVR
ncbi:MAG TPA: CehA/McbA family metallohydrolase, partial [Trueperaceae bacterium]|nr:CehA/McbA family metallohydrolase [Trueperaceae bacterium]